jgi:hypothetical protein
MRVMAAPCPLMQGEGEASLPAASARRHCPTTAKSAGPVRSNARNATRRGMESRRGQLRLVTVSAGDWRAVVLSTRPTKNLQV